MLLGIFRGGIWGGVYFDRGRAAKDLIVNSRGLNKGSSVMELEVSIDVGFGLSWVWV